MANSLTKPSLQKTIKMAEFVLKNNLFVLKHNYFPLANLA